MNDSYTYIIGLVSALFFIVGLALGTTAKESSLQKEFSQTRCAQYSPITGDFEILKDIK